MDLKEIKTVIDLMTKNDLTEFELEKDQFKIRICKSGQGAPSYTIQAPAQQHIPAPSYAAPAPATAPSSAPAAPAANLPSINSPMVGTFYRSPSPDSSSYVDVGSEVNEDTVVCIVEAMKVMNEIKAEVRGIITDIVAENGKPVEFGQPLFRIKPL